MVKRLAWAVVVFIAVTFSTYVLFFVIPTNRPGNTNVQGRDITASVTQATGIHGPVYREYATFLWRIVTVQSLGRSTTSREDVNTTLRRAAPITASLLFGGAVFWMLISIPIGILSALRPRSLLDRAAMLFVLVGISVHPIWLGLILVYVFGHKLQLFPLGGYCDFFYAGASETCGGPRQWAYHLLLPWVTFGMLFAALYVRMIRASVLETLHHDYVTTARAKGASEWRVVRGHVLKNAFLPVITMLGMDVGVAFGGSVFVESVVGLPGRGRLAGRPHQRPDRPPRMGLSVLVTVAILVFNLLVDLLYAWIDPRVGHAPRGLDEEERAQLSAGRAEPSAAKPVQA
ncbi:MAG: peptide/nickel transport system permease protein [Gaiellaceae bacterium]|nr:peptide/nickel transport system permease protein [Gaiellaceae bacterium]